MGYEAHPNRQRTSRGHSLYSSPREDQQQAGFYGLHWCLVAPINMPDWCKNCASTPARASLSQRKWGQSSCCQFHAMSYKPSFYNSQYSIFTSYKSNLFGSKDGQIELYPRSSKRPCRSYFDHLRVLIPKACRGALLKAREKLTASSQDNKLLITWT